MYIMKICQVKHFLMFAQEVFNAFWANIGNYNTHTQIWVRKHKFTADLHVDRYHLVRFG